jgi:hypothetical protein
MEKEGYSSFNLEGGMNKLSLTSKKIVNVDGTTGTVI